MAEPAPASSKPYVVVTLEGMIHTGHEDLAAAESAIRVANAQAEKLGLKTRYALRESEAKAA